MTSLLESYRGYVTAVSPIHIGNGLTYNKKEYILYQAKRPVVIIPDMRKLYGQLCALGYGAAFEDFMLDPEQKDLSRWLKDHKVAKDFYDSIGLYALSNLDSAVKLNGINPFIKDGSGLPYIPGSSIKGMIRTCLMIWEIAKKQKLNRIPQIKVITEPLERPDKSFLRNECKDIEAQIFNTLERNKKKFDDMVNSCMSGLIVGDSDCFDYKQLTLAQVSALQLNGQDKKLNVFKECIIPGTKVGFTLTLDKSLCPYSLENIREAIDFSAKLIFAGFYSKFKVTPINSSGIFWLGGNTGFTTKTIMHALYDENEAVKNTDQVFKHTLGKKVYKMHGHARDVEIGMAPHTCRCCSYYGKLYDMGRCRVDFESLK
ncbi:type III-A CRISPR-associated RAMP protein Csm5 [Succinatimonas hippei]|uniref:type III-A CRISPR-associated RAMP protein Csm5 n=1 Tax=Succinatimonas hippei TaxID=626938 RepID=UPI00255C65EC|nr:type III-A CRISPR-associated RAMP protein Csm5 [Succinatimonas hippei]